jgi:hypothetical protein
MSNRKAAVLSMLAAFALAGCGQGGSEQPAGSAATDPAATSGDMSGAGGDRTGGGDTADTAAGDKGGTATGQ